MSAYSDQRDAYLNGDYGTTQPVEVEDISLAALAATLQAGFNANHISWNSINWDIFAVGNPNTPPDYSVTRDIDTISVFIPISAVTPPEYIEVTDASGQAVTETVIFDDSGNRITPAQAEALGVIVREDTLELAEGTVLTLDQADGLGVFVTFDSPIPIVDDGGEFILDDNGDLTFSGTETLIQSGVRGRKLDGSLISSEISTDEAKNLGVIIPETGTELVADSGAPLSEADASSMGVTVTFDVPVFELDAYGNPVRIIDSAADLFLAIGGTDDSDHLRNRDYSFPDGNAQERQITGAFMGFAGDDVLYSENVYNPMLMGGKDDDTYILQNLETGNQNVFTQIVESGNDGNDTIISYGNDWAIALDIDGQHLVLSDVGQTDVIVIWDYKVPEAKIENFWFDFDNNGINEHYNFDEFIATLHSRDYWQGSFRSEELGLSRPTLTELTQAVTEAVTLSTQIENYREAGEKTALSIARLYQTALDRTPDEEGLNYWIDRWESEQLSLRLIANEFYLSEEFTSTYGDLDDAGYITQLYANVLDRAPEQSGFDYWTGQLTQEMDRSEVMARFSDSLENKINTEVQLSGLAEDVVAGHWIL